MMRDFRYLCVIESSTDRLVGFLQSPGGRSVYEIYENHKGNKRENAIPKNFTSFTAPLFFSQD